MSRFGLLLQLLPVFIPAFIPNLCIAAESEADAPALLRRLQEHRGKFPSLTADFQEEKVTRLLRQPLLTRGTIAFSAPNRFRREIQGANPSLTVCDGREMWIYYPNFKEAEHYQLGRHSFFDDSLAALTAGLNVQDVAKFYRYEAFSEARGHRLVLRPRTAGLRRIIRSLTVWVDDDFLIARTETTLPQGDRIVTRYTNQRAAAVPDSTFEFKPPAGVKISQPLERK